jgi:hypothetical protein
MDLNVARSVNYVVLFLTRGKNMQDLRKSGSSLGLSFLLSKGYLSGVRVRDSYPECRVTGHLLP